MDYLTKMLQSPGLYSAHDLRSGAMDIETLLSSYRRMKEVFGSNFSEGALVNGALVLLDTAAIVSKRGKV